MTDPIYQGYIRTVEGGLIAIKILNSDVEREPSRGILHVDDGTNSFSIEIVDTLNKPYIFDPVLWALISNAIMQIPKDSPGDML